MGNDIDDVVCRYVQCNVLHDVSNDLRTQKDARENCRVNGCFHRDLAPSDGYGYNLPRGQKR